MRYLDACDGTAPSLEIESPEEMDQLGAALAEIARPGQVIGLVGPLGSGKTRLTRALAVALGADERAVSSPTFTMIQEYEGRIPIHHFDTYRLPSVQAFEDLGPWDYLGGEGICVIEWSDRVDSILPTTTWTLTILPTAETRRLVRLALPSPDLQALRTHLPIDFDDRRQAVLEFG